MTDEVETPIETKDIYICADRGTPQITEDLNAFGTLIASFEKNSVEGLVYRNADDWVPARESGWVVLYRVPVDQAQALVQHVWDSEDNKTSDIHVQDAGVRHYNLGIGLTKAQRDEFDVAVRR